MFSNSLLSVWSIMIRTLKSLRNFSDNVSRAYFDVEALVILRKIALASDF